MTVDIWTPADSALIQAVGPYAVPHPYSAGSLRVIVFSDAHPSVTLDPADYIVSPASSDTGGAVWLTDEAFAIYQGRSLQVQRETEAQQGWQGLVGPREKGLERQLDLLTMILQELSEPARNALRTFTRMQPFAAVPGGYVRFDEDGQPQSSGPLPDMDALSDTILGQMTEYAYTFSGDGTATPHPLPMALDDVRKAFVAVHGQVMRPGKDYRLSDDGRSLIPLGTDGGALNVWPWGDNNHAVWIRRQLDLAAITSDDVTHDGELLSGVLNDIGAKIAPENTFYLEDYLHPADLAAALDGDTDAQDATRVTQGFNAFHLAVLTHALAVNRRNVLGIYPGGTFAVNRRLMNDAFSNLLWAGGSPQSRVTFRVDGVMRLKLKGWLDGRASVRTDGVYGANGIAFPVPNFVWEWSQNTGSQYLAKINGKIIIEGEGNAATDPMGFGFYRVNAANFGDALTVVDLKNIGIVYDSVFNSRGEQFHVSSGVGYSITEYGGTGLAPTNIRYLNTGTTITAVNAAAIPVPGFFKSHHVGKLLGLERQGRMQDIGDAPDEGALGGASRRAARWFEIASIGADGSTCEVTVAPPYTQTTDQWVLDNRRLSFHAVRATTAASSDQIVLSAPITDDLVGRSVIVAGAGFADNAASWHGDNLTAQVVSQVVGATTTTLTVSHAARRERILAPICFAAQVHFGSLGGTVSAPTTRKCDDLRFARAWCEAGTSPVVQVTIQNVTKLTFGHESKWHGSPLVNNWGANFTCAMMSKFSIRAFGDFTHGRHSPFFGMFTMAGDLSRAQIDGGVSSWTADNGSAMFYVDPVDAAPTRVWDVFFSATDEAYGFPDPDAGQVFERGGPNYRPGLIKAGSSERNPMGEIPLGPQALRAPSRAPAWGSVREDAAAALARGMWAPTEGMLYTIGDGLFEGAAGDTSVPDLPGLKGAGPYVTPEMYGAKGDGLANDTAALKAALRTKKTVLCRPRATYLVDDLDLQDNEKLNLNDAELRPYSSACRWLVQMRGTNTVLENGLLNDIDYVTSKTATVTAGASAGGTVITVDDIGEITQHMFLFVRSSNRREWTHRRIQSISGNTIILSGAAQADIPVGATVYAGFGLVSLYHNQSDNFLDMRNLRIRRGHVGIYAKAHDGVSLGNIRTFACQIYGQLIAGEAILGQVNNWDRINTWASGSTENTQTVTFTATAGQTTIDLGSLGFLIPAQQLYHKNEVSIRVNGAAKLEFKNAGSPGAGEYTMSQSGLIATIQPLTAGDSVQVSLFRCAVAGLIVDPSGRDAGIVSGAHRFLRTSYNSFYDGAYFDSETETVGLLHLNMCVFDACRRRSITLIHVSNFFATHLFLGYSPKPLNIRLKSGDRRMKFVGLHTERDSSDHFDQTYATSGYEVECLCDAPADALDTHGLQKVQISPWWGPEFSINDPDGAVALGELGAKSGTYTVTIKDTAGNTSPTTVTGRWRMLDANEVQVDFDTLSGIDTTGLTTSNAARIGLPFTAAETKIGQIALTSMPSVTVTGTTTYAAFMPRVTAGDNFCTIRSFAPMGNQMGQTVANLTGANINNFSIRYRITR